MLLCSAASLLLPCWVDNSLHEDLVHTTVATSIAPPDFPIDLVHVYLRAKEAGDAALGIHGGGCGCLSPLRLLNGSGVVQPVTGRGSVHAAFVFGLTKLSLEYTPRVQEGVKALLPFTSLDVVVMVLEDAHDPRALRRLQNAFARMPRVHIKKVRLPFDAARVAASWLGFNKGNKNCCGAAEMMKLQAFGLPYDRVIVLDLDVRLTMSIDDLVHCPETFLGSLGIGSPLNAGVFVGPGGRHQSTMLQVLVQALESDSHRYANDYHTGWGRGMGPCRRVRAIGASGERICHGAESLQGFLWHFFGPGGEGAASAGLLNPCIYDFQGPLQEHACRQMDGHLRLPRVVHKKSPGLTRGLRRARGLPAYGPARCPPKYFILGARKGGTTALHTMISKHPGVRPFNLKGRPQDGEIPVEPADGASTARYREHYKHLLGSRKGAFMSGESSVQRLVNSFRDVPLNCGYLDKRFVVLLRDPIQRCHSQLLMRKRLHTDEWKAGESPSLNRVYERNLEAFLNATSKDPSWLDGPEVPRELWPSARNCVYEGIYVAHLRRWLYFVPTTVMRAYLTEDFRRNNHAVLRDVLDWLGLPLATYPWNQRVHVNYRPGVIGSEDALEGHLRTRLQDVFDPYNRKLEAFLHSPMRLWPYKEDGKVTKDQAQWR